MTFPHTGAADDDGVWKAGVVPSLVLLTVTAFAAAGVPCDFPRWLSLFRLLSRSLARAIDGQPISNATASPFATYSRPTQSSPGTSSRLAESAVESGSGKLRRPGQKSSG